MERKLDFHGAVEYGISKMAAKQEGKEINVSGIKLETPELPLDRLNAEKKDKVINCKRCFEKHNIRNCPA